MMKYYVYKTTNLLNGKYYIGKHASSNIDNDQYLGSGVYITRAVKKYGKQNFKRQILKQCDTQQQAFTIQQSLVNQLTINDQKCYNLVFGGYGFNSGYVIVIDEYGAHHRIKNTDERFLSGQLKSLHCGMVNVIDDQGNKFSVSNNDERYLSGQLIAITRGWITVRDKNGKCFRVKVDDERRKTGQIVQVNTGMIPVKDKNGNTSRITTSQLKNSQVYSGVNKNLVVVKDTDNNIFQVSINDPRYLSGQLVHVTRGTSTVKDKDGNRLRVPIDDPRLLSGELVGITKNSFWITNGTKSKTIYDGDSIPDGWKRGKASTNMWITDGISNISVKNDQEIQSGWRRGRTYNSHKNKV